MNRRDFLSTSSKFACACTLGTASFFFNKCANPTEPSAPTDTTGVKLNFDLTSEEFTVLQIDGGSVVTSPNEIDSAGLILLRSGEMVKAFTRRCTHQGVQLNAFSEGIVVCTFGHGAQFNSNGQHFSGPGEGSLKSYDTQLDENILIVYGG